MAMEGVVVVMGEGVYFAGEAVVVTRTVDNIVASPLKEKAVGASKAGTSWHRSNGHDRH